MPVTTRRLQLIEYGQPEDLSSQISVLTGIGKHRADSLLIEAGRRAGQNTGLFYNPLTHEGKGIRAKDIAGIIQLGQNLELEVIPKFLGTQEPNGAWREDFFYIATLSRHGRLLNNEKISSSSGAPKSISTLIARAFNNIYLENRRRPLRSYRRITEFDFSFDGDIDPTDMIFPSSEGFRQEKIQFSRSNNWNSIIQFAAYRLLSEVYEPKTAAQLIRVIDDIGAQKSPVASRMRKVPARQKRWEPMLELAIDVIKDLSLTYNPGTHKSPGFLINTWRVWEDLVGLGMRMAFPKTKQFYQKGFSLGLRRKADKANEVKVYPDYFVAGSEAYADFIIDAKYKGNADRGAIRISESDIYESFAFAKATGAKKVVLAYPLTYIPTAAEVGTCTMFETVTIDDIVIYGIQVEVRNISNRNGLKLFSSNLRAGITSLLSKN